MLQNGQFAAVNPIRIRRAFPVMGLKMNRECAMAICYNVCSFLVLNNKGIRNDVLIYVEYVCTYLCCDALT